MIRRSLTVLWLLVCLASSQATFVTRQANAQEPETKQSSFDSDGVQIRYLVTGREDGEPVVLIHGFAGNIERQWGPVITALKTDFKCIGMDCRGHGKSGKPHDPEKYGIEMVRDVARLLDHLKIEKAHLAGYSMGAGIALRFAIEYPQRVLSITLGGGSGMLKGQEELIAAVADSLEKGNGLAPLITALTPKDRPAPTPEAIKIIDELVFAVNDAKALGAVARAATKEKLSDRPIAEIAAPIVVIIGAEDPLRSGVDQLKKLLPKTAEVVIDKADHMSAFRRQEFVAAIKKFLDENQQATTK